MLIIVPNVVDIILQPMALWILLRPNTSTNAEGLTVKYTAKREYVQISRYRLLEVCFTNSIKGIFFKIH